MIYAYFIFIYYITISNFFFFFPNRIYNRTLFAFVDIFGTVDSFVTGRTRTRVRTVYRTRVADCVGVTRVGRARVVEVAKETCNEKKKKCFPIKRKHFN